MIEVALSSKLIKFGKAEKCTFSYQWSCFASQQRESLLSIILSNHRKCKRDFSNFIMRACSINLFTYLILNNFLHQNSIGHYCFHHHTSHLQSMVCVLYTKIFSIITTHLVIVCIMLGKPRSAGVEGTNVIWLLMWDSFKLKLAAQDSWNDTLHSIYFANLVLFPPSSLATGRISARPATPIPLNR